jgi:hypothetical protein
MKLRPARAQASRNGPTSASLSGRTRPVSSERGGRLLGGEQHAVGSMRLQTTRNHSRERIRHTPPANLSSSPQHVGPLAVNAFSLRENGAPWEGWGPASARFHEQPAVSSLQRQVSKRAQL